MLENQKEHKKHFKDQYDDEEVLYVFRKHPIVMRKALVIACFGPLLGVLPAAIQPTLGFPVFFGGLALGFVISFLVMLPAWIGWFYSIFIVTDQRLIQISQKGLFTRSVVDIGLAKIQSTNYEIKGIQATLLGFGTIVVQTYMGDMVVHEVYHPEKVIKKIATILKDQGIVAEMLDEPSATEN
jgi:hypothetical protein